MSSSEKPGLYVHVPFCRTKCPYCDFYSGTSFFLVRDWTEALSREISLYEEGCGLFDSLYLGGGTPSVLACRELARVFEQIFEHFRFSPDAEITVEANPDDITREKLEVLKTYGVNRISLGVQSLDEDELRALGRRHTAARAEKALEAIRNQGFSNLGIDLMYGLPQQKQSAWRRTLARALDYRPEHLSCYQLTVHDETPLGRMLAEGKIRLPDEEEQRSFFLLTAEILRRDGYVHYEVSNFARQECYVSRHNTKYWRRVPTLGLGPSAHSYRDGIRWWNVSSTRDYCEMLRAGRAPVAGRESLREDQRQLESLSLGLRTREGIDLALVRDSPGVEKILAELKDAELIEVRENRILPTTLGFLVADSLPLLFVQG